jgi:Coiled-coil domain-containing protein 124 /Oxs1
MKAAFKAYEEAQLPAMREDKPGLKLSQYKQLVRFCSCIVLLFILHRYCAVYRMLCDAVQMRQVVAQTAEVVRLLAVKCCIYTKHSTRTASATVAPLVCNVLLQALLYDVASESSRYSHSTAAMSYTSERTAAIAVECMQLAFDFTNVVITNYVCCTAYRSLKLGKAHQRTQ